MWQAIDKEKKEKTQKEKRKSARECLMRSCICFFFFFFLSAHRIMILCVLLIFCLVLIIIRSINIICISLIVIYLLFQATHRLLTANAFSRGFMAASADPDAAKGYEYVLLPGEKIVSSQKGNDNKTEKSNVKVKTSTYDTTMEDDSLPNPCKIS